MQCLSRRDYIFVAGCVLVYCAAVLLIPPYTPLIEPDSTGYIEFVPTRSAYYPAFLYICRAVGLNLIEITLVQIGIFGLALAYLLTVLLRARFPRILLGIFVALLAANVLYSSFHRSILTESLFFSAGAVTVGLWIDYLRTGHVRFLVLAGFALGLMIGIRPAGIGLLPMHAFAVWIKRPQNPSKWLMLLFATVPVVIGAGGERIIYRAVHGGNSQSTAPNLMIGLAAMLIKPDMTFTGPHAQALKQLSAQLYESYGPVQKYLADTPSLAVRAQLSAAYEALSQFHAIAGELAEAAKRENTTVDELRTELGKQITMQNIPGYLKLTLLNYFGQWSIAAQNFPPTARALAAYANANPAISLGGGLPDKFLHPSPTLVGLLVYPTFLIAGAVTLLLSFVFLIFLARPALMNGAEGFYLGLAAVLSAMCHGYTLFISLINEWTPRFLMAVIPQLEIVALCLTMILLHRCKLIVLHRPV